MNLHKTGMKCHTTNVAIRSDKWPTHVTRAADPSSWDAEHEGNKGEAYRDIGSIFHTRQFSAALFLFVTLDSIPILSQNGENIRHSLLTLLPVFFHTFRSLSLQLDVHNSPFFALCSYPSPDRGKQNEYTPRGRRISSGRERGKSSYTSVSGFATSPILRAACQLAWPEQERFSGSTPEENKKNVC